jgi:hypothetical protein
MLLTVSILLVVIFYIRNDGIEGIQWKPSSIHIKMVYVGAPLRRIKPNLRGNILVSDVWETAIDFEY